MARRVTQTFTTLSQPQETITGLLELGLNRTHDTLEHNAFRIASCSGARASHLPLSVALLFDIEFAFAKSVPQLNGAVTAATDDLSVVSREGYGEDIRGVANEAASGETGVEIPETKGVVPR
jgi:hypothetical protein